MPRRRNHRHVLERLRRHLTDDFAGHQRLRAAKPRNPFRDPEHHAPIDDHSQRAGHAQRHLPLQLAKWHEVETRSELIARQQPRQLARFVLRGARQKRIAVKVHERRPQPRRIMRHAATGESMPPESRPATRPAVPTGSPPGPGSLPK